MNFLKRLFSKRVDTKRSKYEKRQTKQISKKMIMEKCYFCGKTDSEFRNYKHTNGSGIKVCSLCVEYAERRAFRKGD